MLAKAVAVLAVIAVQVVVIGALGAALGWEPAVRGIPAALVALVLGTWAFAALALLLGGTLRAEGVLAVANLLWVAMLGLGGVVVAGTELPDQFATVLRVLPSAALGDSLRAALVDGHAAPGAWLVLTAWALGGDAGGATVLPLERLTVRAGLGPAARRSTRASRPTSHQGRSVATATTSSTA